MLLELFLLFVHCYFVGKQRFSVDEQRAHVFTLPVSVLRFFQSTSLWRISLHLVLRRIL